MSAGFYVSEALNKPAQQITVIAKLPWHDLWPAVDYRALLCSIQVQFVLESGTLVGHNVLDTGNMTNRY